MHKIFLPILFVLAACSTTKRTTQTTDVKTESTEDVRVATSDSNRTTETIQTQDSAHREIFAYWSVQLSNDTNAPFLFFSLPDGSSFQSRAGAVSGTGKLTETRTAAAQTEKTQVSGKVSDSVRKSRFDQVFQSSQKTKEKDAPNAFLFYGILALLAVAAFVFFYRRA